MNPEAHQELMISGKKRKITYLGKKELFDRLVVELFTDKVYEPGVRGLKKKNIVLDVGGYIGLASLYFSDYFEKVYVLEPDKKVFGALLKNIKENGMEGKIIPFNLALKNTNGKSTISMIVNTYEYEAEGITLKKFMADNKIDYIDLIKMDIEGGEYEVLEGDGFQSVADKVGRILVEAHPYPIGKPERVWSVSPLLASLGFKVEQVRHESASTFTLNDATGKIIGKYSMPVFLAEKAEIQAKKPVCFFTIASKHKHIQEQLAMMTNSLKKFHPDIPLIVMGDKERNPVMEAHPDNHNRLYAIFGQKLAQEYELVIVIDSDSIVTGDLNHIINDKTYDVGCVLNNNLIDPKLTVWDVDPNFYVNCGFIAIRGERPWRWWNKLNHGIGFTKYRFREQDMLNIMVHYGDLTCKIFDFSRNWHGLVSKGQWDKLIVKGEEIVLPKTEGVCADEKIIKVIHWAGGPVPKMNYHVSFKKPVVERIEYLVRPKEG